MATIGQQLLQPEAGWRRYEENHPNIVYQGVWNTEASSALSGGSAKWARNPDNNYSFKFYGSKLRIITDRNTNRNADSIQVRVDGEVQGIINTYGSTQGQTVSFEYYGEMGFHEVEVNIIYTDGNSLNQIDAIDIDEAGYLMTPVGSQLLQPEAGWKRYDDSHPAMVFRNVTMTDNVSVAYGGKTKYVVNGDVRFSFIGTKIRLIGDVSPNKSKNISVKVDGSIVASFSEYVSTDGVRQTLVYELLGMKNELHTIEVSSSDTVNNFCVDAIDIDADGRLLHPDEVLTPAELEVGKRIRCHYQTPTSGQVGTFTNLGQETYVDGINDFIPPASSATPNGDFYYICVDKDHLGRWKLIADRNIQHSISWDTLNSAGIASGSGLPTKIIEPLTFTLNDELILTSSANRSDEFLPSNLFNNQTNNYWMTSGIPNLNYGWVAMKFNKLQRITHYRISSISYADQLPLTWDFEGLNTNGEWVVLDSRSGYDTAKWKSINCSLLCDIRNVGEYTNYRLNVKNTDSTYLRISNLDLYTMPNVTFTTRLLTGGISSTDKDNEWDKYIVSSDLNGSIVAGDNNVWNCNVQANYDYTSWTSTTSGTNSRARRGGQTINGHWSGTVATNYTSVYVGFRPLLLIEELGPPPPPPIKGSFFLYEGEYKKLVEGSAASERLVSPKLTSDTSYGIATTSSSYGNSLNYSAWKAFDGDITTDGNVWESFMLDNSTSSQFVSYQYPDDGVIVNKYVIYSTADLANMPRDWVFESSKDGVSWNVLDVRNQITWLNAKSPLEFEFPNNDKYKYYKITISKNNGGSTMEMQELEFYFVEKFTPSSWQTISTTPPTAEQFDVEGMKDLSVLDRKEVTHLIPMDDNTLSGQPLGNGKVFKEKVKYKDLIKLEIIPK